MNVQVINCPNCGEKMACTNRDDWLSNNKFRCNKCNKTYVEKVNMLFLIVEIYILLKVAEAFSMFIVNNLAFITHKEVVSFIIELILVCLFGYIEAKNSNLLVKLGLIKLIEIDDNDNKA